MPNSAVRSPGGTPQRNAEMIVANTTAMRAALELSARVDADAILAMTAR